MDKLRLCFIGPAASIPLPRWVGWFAARGHETTVLTVEPAREVTFQQIDLQCGLPRKLDRLLSALRIGTAVRQIRPDVVHIHYARGLAWGLALKPYHPYVVTPWGSDILEEQGAFRDWGARVLTLRLFRQADLVTAHSAYMEACVRAMLPLGSPVERVGWGVNLHLFRVGLDVAPLRHRWELGEKTRVVFSPRLAQPFYRHDRVVRVLPEVLAKVPDVCLVISQLCADPAYVDRLRHLSSQLGVADHVRFVGAIPYIEMPFWLNLAEVVVMVPPSDGMPSTLLEAMACGAFPVLSGLPQYGDLIKHGVNGFLVGPEDGDLAEALVSALTDPVFRQDAARENRKIVAEVADQDHEMVRMEQLYQKLAESPSTSSTDQREAVGQGEHRFMYGAGVKASEKNHHLVFLALVGRYVKQTLIRGFCAVIRALPQQWVQRARDRFAVAHRGCSRWRWYMDRFVDRINREMVWRELNGQGVVFIRETPGDKYQVFQYVYDHYVKGPVDYLEFGVYRGESLAWWMRKLGRDSNLYGVDSFNGLPEDWHYHARKGEFDCQGHVPEIASANVQFIKGKFEDSLQPFFESVRLKPDLIIHLDADLYSSTVTALRAMKDVLSPRTILIFDEYWDQKNEYKALQDFVVESKKTFEYLAVSEVRAVIRFTS